MQKKADSSQAAQLLRPVETQRASAAIYEQVKGLILDGQLKPGDRLPSERALMDLMGRSRPTIREALRMLERDGFIHTVPAAAALWSSSPPPTWWCSLWTPCSRWARYR